MSSSNHLFKLIQNISVYINIHFIIPKKSLKVQTFGQNAYTLCKSIIISFNTLEKLRISLVLGECVRLYVCVCMCAALNR